MAYDLKYGKVTVEREPHTPIAEDEPVIVFRAQDKLTVPLLARYENLYVATQPDGFDADKDVFVIAVRGVRDAFMQWQKDNPDKTKLPD